MGFVGPLSHAVKLFSNTVEFGMERIVFGFALFGVAFVDRVDCGIALLYGFGSGFGGTRPKFYSLHVALS